VKNVENQTSSVQVEIPHGQSFDHPVSSRSSILSGRGNLGKTPLPQSVSFSGWCNRGNPLTVGMKQGCDRIGFIETKR
jgi:hypothetical protein